MKKTATADKKPTRRRKPKQRPRVYREPRSAAELKIMCAVCSDPARWFDPERARRYHLQGFICEKEPRSSRAQKLLVREQAAAAAHVIR